MNILASTGEDGTFVSQNADNLSGGINASQTSFVVNADTFNADDVVIIDSERLLVGVDAGGGSYTGCTRAYESTTAASHASSSNVRLKDGTTVLTHTFNGSEQLSLIRANALERDAVFGIEIDGTVKYLVSLGPYEGLEKSFGSVPWKPASGTVIKVLCWTFADVNVFAEMQS